MTPPSAGDVTAAMGRFSAETQRGLAGYAQANPTRMRQWAAEHLRSGSLTGEQHSALLTLGSAPQTALKDGISHALTTLDTQAAAGADTSGGASANSSQTSEQAANAPTPTAAPVDSGGEQSSLTGGSTPKPTNTPSSGGAKTGAPGTEQASPSSSASGTGQAGSSSPLGVDGLAQQPDLSAAGDARPDEGDSSSSGPGFEPFLD